MISYGQFLQGSYYLKKNLRVYVSNEIFIVFDIGTLAGTDPKNFFPLPPLPLPSMLLLIKYETSPRRRCM